MSRKVIGTLSAAEMLAAIDAATIGLPETDAEWKSREEWEVVWGKSQTTTSSLIRKACAAGLMEHKTQRRQTLRGLYPTPVYRWIGKAKESSAPQQPSKSRVRSRS